MEFFEPEEGYKTDKGLKSNSGNKITALTLFLILSLILLFVVQKDIFGFFEKEGFGEKCNFQNTYTRVDDDGSEIEKITKALKDNEGNLKQIEGFIEAEVEENNIIDSKRQYMISLFVEKSSEEIDKIPDFICGHKVVIENK